jgi:hypothetical protein
LGSPNDPKWETINQYDDSFNKASDEFGVPANLLKAMAWIESGGAGHAPGGKVAERDDGFGDGLSVGLMQVKPNIWQKLVPNANAYESLGNIRLAAAILKQGYEENGTWEGAVLNVYFPKDDPNGTSQKDYIIMVDAHLKDLGVPDGIDSLEGGNCGDTSSDGSEKTPSNPSTGQSRCVVTKVGNPSGTPTLPASCNSGSGGSPGSCGEAPKVNYTTTEEYTKAIAEKWGIMVTLPLEQMQYAWEEFHEIDCLGILQDIEGSVINSWGNDYSSQQSCPGDAAVDLFIGTHFGSDWVKALLLHELTHIWQICSSRGEANLLEVPDAYSSEGGLTNYSRSGCGFGGINLHNEDHADTIGLYFNPEADELTCGNGASNPFSGGKFPLHKRIAENGKQK